MTTCVMNILINAAVMVYCVVASFFWGCIYDVIDALAHMMWHILQFVHRRVDRLNKIVEEFFPDDK